MYLLSISGSHWSALPFLSASKVVDRPRVPAINKQVHGGGGLADIVGGEGQLDHSGFDVAIRLAILLKCPDFSFSSTKFLLSAMGSYFKGVNYFEINIMIV